MRSPAWYVHRLRAMTPLEIASRVRDGAALGLQKGGWLLASEPPAPSLADPGKPWLRAPDAAAEAGCLEAAERLLAGDWQVFGTPVRARPGEYDWNRDPLTGTVAPLEFGAGLDLHSRDVVGDIKYLWEPNRHLELVALAQAYALRGERRHLEAIRAIVDSWITACPYPRGPNWSSGLENAIRLINWAVTWQLVGGSGSPLFAGEEGGAFRGRWLRSVYQHLHFVRGHYSRFSSANNHLMGEAAGVFIGGSTWPLWPEALRWRDAAYGIVLQQAEAQIAPDGVSREQTFSYQRFVLEFLLLCRMAAVGAGKGAPAGIDGRLRASLRFLGAVMDASGRQPMVGDGDDGCVVRFGHGPSFSPLRSVLVACGRTLGVAPQLRASDVDQQAARWLHGGAASEPATAPDAAGAQGGLAFPDGGYYLLGDAGPRADAVRMLVDAGPLGYLSIAAHGHADALAVTLSVHGRDVLVDPGTFVYHGAPEWRRHFRGTRAHNTITVDGRDQSEWAGSFMWLRHARAHCLRFEASPGRDEFSGEHDGYRRLDDPVTHRRDVVRDGRCFTVTDRLECAGAHEVEQWWHFSEDCRVVREGSTLVVENAGVTVRFALDAGLRDVVLHRGSESPRAGWVSRAYGSRVPATSVCCRARIDGPRSFVTRIECPEPSTVQATQLSPA